MSEAEFRVFQRATARYNAIQIAKDLHLVEDPEITWQRVGGSLNHACDSNLWMADEVTLIARRHIVSGEELTVDYALFTTQQIGIWINLVDVAQLFAVVLIWRAQVAVEQSFRCLIECFQHL